MPRSNNRRWWPIVLAVIATIFGLLWMGEQRQRQQLRVTFLDVGQGDSIFIQTPSGHDVLIDGGPGQAVLAELGMAMAWYDRTIDLMVLTHPDADHLAGLLPVLERYTVKRILYTGVADDSKLYAEWRRLVQEEQADVIIAEPGSDIIFGDVVLDVLYPFYSLAGETLPDTNAGSVVTRLTYGDTSFMLTGDAPIDVERELIETAQLQSTVLKVGHHGSKTSTSEDFVTAVNPAYAVIQVGEKNRYGHPAADVINRLNQRGVEELRTDAQGTVRCRSDGERVGCGGEE